ncbi:SpoIIE family protein phosphatase [Streptomyces sp. NPDC059578]|uniref:SpoIIE family protein phosphatase n=1 Tax=Streptomyces sp. NPDC059578 TaxID=3346874 RepID=UPI0036AB509E
MIPERTDERPYDEAEPRVPAGPEADGPGLRGAVLALLAARDTGALLATALDALRTGSGSHTGAFYLAGDDGWLRLTAEHGLAGDLVERFPVLAPDATFAVSVAARERRLFHGLADDPGGGVAEPGTDGSPEPGARPVAFVTAPLLVDDRCLGALLVMLDPPRPLSATDDRHLAMVATLCAHRIDHLVALERAGVPAGSPKLDPAERTAFRRSRQTRLELAMSSGSIGSWEWHVPSGEVVWDERQMRLFGFDPADFDSRVETFRAAVHPEDRAALDRALDESLLTGTYYAAYRVVLPDGTLRWIEVKGALERTPDGTPDRVIGVSWDETEQHERMRRREARRDFVLRVTRAFAAARATRDIIDVMGRIVLPQVGGRALALHIEHDGRLLLEGAIGYEEPARERLRLMGTVRDNPLAAALAEGHPLFLPSRAAYLERFPDPRFRPPREHHAFVLLPLASADGTVGSCLISYAQPREFTSDDQTVATAISGILTQSLARTRLADVSRRRMTDLQRLMMPRSLPRLPGYAIAARYRPAAGGMQVGGDWFDVLPRDDGGASLVIGDVQGHSAQAAGVMGQLRTALRAHASDGFRANGLMCRGNQTLWGLDTERFATCCIVDIAVGSGEYRMVRAGHPHPLQTEPDGSVHEVVTEGGLPLGCLPDDIYPVHHGVLAPGATLLLYTDGLVDTPDGPYDEAVERVRDALARWAVGTRDGDAQSRLEFLADTLVSRDFTDPGHDDIALLLIRHLPG